MPGKGQTTSVIDRIKDKTIFKEDGCWIFTGKLTGRGYGNIWYQGKTVRIGRLICHIYHGADLNDLSWTANHIRECRNQACWNPDHLYVGNQLQNVQDQIATNNFNYGTNNLNGGENFNKEKWLKSKRGE